MSPDKFFYVITRDGQIFEIGLTQERMHSAITAQTNKGLFSVPTLGIYSLNGVDISKILNESQYRNHLATAKPAEYVQNGVWYNKRHEFLRHEPWKKLEIEKKSAQIEPPKIEPPREITPEQREKNDAWLKQNMPKVYERMVQIRNKHDPKKIVGQD